MLEKFFSVKHNSATGPVSSVVHPFIMTRNVSPTTKRVSLPTDERREKTYLKSNNQGSILILSLWILSLLSIFAVHIGMKVRHRAALLSRIENRSQLHYIAEAGVKKAIASLRQDLARHNFIYTAYGKYYRHNNKENFCKIHVGDGEFSVFPSDGNEPQAQKTLNYGLMDEERKANINVVDTGFLKLLIQQVLSVSDEEALALAVAIIDWRQLGTAELQGFYSDEYYANLEDSYEPKRAAFETLDELLLVKGMNQEILGRLRPFLTIYGNGQININTAPREVLRSLGLNEDLTEKILLVRQGLDGIEATVDDYVFYKTFDIAAEMAQFIEMSEEGAKAIDALNEAGVIKTNSLVFSIEAHARLSNRADVLSTECVYLAPENKIVYWREK